MALPVIEWRSNTSPYNVISSITLTGTGTGGHLQINSDYFSAHSIVRLYNNFAATAGIADALNCQLACYDDTVNEGIATKYPVINTLFSPVPINYNGTSIFEGINAVYLGGNMKHAFTTNNGTLSGTGANYFTIDIIMLTTPDVPLGAYSQGLWVEYDSVA